MHSITVQFKFCCGHRILDHKGKCKNAHGHNYVAEVTVTNQPNLDNLGMVADFKVLKEAIGGWIDDHWDHQFLLNSDDAVLLKKFSGVTPVYQFSGKNPTAENMAEELCERVQETINDELDGLDDPKLEVVEVRLQETDGCWATFRPEPKLDGSMGGYSDDDEGEGASDDEENDTDPEPPPVKVKKYPPGTKPR